MTVPMQRTPKSYADNDGTETWPLVERAQAGDRSAWADIYHRYQDVVFRFIYFRVGNRPLAEDLTSDTFLRAMKRLHSFTYQGRDIGAWFITIARNLVADHFKSGRYRLEITTGDVLDADRVDDDRLTDPARAAVDTLTNAIIADALTKIAPDQRTCIELRYFAGYSVAETAVAMARNEGAIKALQARAVRSLGQSLPDGFDLTGRMPLPRFSGGKTKSTKEKASC